MSVSCSFVSTLFVPPTTASFFHLIVAAAALKKQLCRFLADQDKSLNTGNFGDEESQWSVTKASMRLANFLAVFGTVLYGRLHLSKPVCRLL